MPTVLALAQRHSGLRTPALLALYAVLVTVLVILYNLDPVAIRIKQECHVPHATVCKSLLPITLEILETLASSIKIINGDAYLPVRMGPLN